MVCRLGAMPECSALPEEIGKNEIRSMAQMLNRIINVRVNKAGYVYPYEMRKRNTVYKPKLKKKD